jgi:hypothetical protein
MAIKLEDFLPGVKYNGLNTNKNTAFGGSNTFSGTSTFSGPVTLPARVSRTGEQSETVSGNKTLDEGDSGVVQRVDTDGAVVTLPATVLGTTYIIENAGSADGAVGISVSPNAADKIMGNGFTSADNKDAINTKATAKVGDRIVLVADGANGWFVQSVIGTWAREG